MTLPDCPHCHAAETLTAISQEAGVTLAECSCCSKMCRVDVWGDVVRYVEKGVISGP